MRWITPQVGDPTFSILKAHLLFEELLNTYLERVLAHASALRGARLTFAQRLAVAKASSHHLAPDHWVWKAISDLNRIRNSLSHEAQPKDLPQMIDEYVSRIVQNTEKPLPEPAIPGTVDEDREMPTGHYFTKVDIATIGLYYYTAGLLGFDVDEWKSLDGGSNAG